MGVTVLDHVEIISASLGNVNVFWRKGEEEDRATSTSSLMALLMFALVVREVKRVATLLMDVMEETDLGAYEYVKQSSDAPIIILLIIIQNK